MVIDRFFYLLAFFFQKHLPKYINYEIYDKKPLAIIKAFEE